MKCFKFLVMAEKTINKLGALRDAILRLEASLRRDKAARKHIGRYGNEELLKEHERLMYEKEKYIKHLYREKLKYGNGKNKGAEIQPKQQASSGCLDHKYH